MLCGHTLPCVWGLGIKHDPKQNTWRVKIPNYEGIRSPNPEQISPVNPESLIARYYLDCLGRTLPKDYDKQEAQHRAPKGWDIARKACAYVISLDILQPKDLSGAFRFHRPQNKSELWNQQELTFGRTLDVGFIAV